jgi:hypothetical protein
MALPGAPQRAILLLLLLLILLLLIPPTTSTAVVPGMGPFELRLLTQATPSTSIGGRSRVLHSAS